MNFFIRNFVCQLVLIGLIGVNIVFAAESEPTETIPNEPMVETTAAAPAASSIPPTTSTDTLEPNTPINMLSTLKGFGGQSNANLFSGALGFEYPLQIPAGRNGVQPNLSLFYSSQDQNFASTVGQGWSLPIDKIYRYSKTGVNNLYTNEKFAAEINGQMFELVLIDAAQNLYGAKVETQFFEFRKNSTGWVVRTPSGAKYWFGSNMASQQENPIDNTQIFKWMVDKVEDQNGNFMTYSYTKTNGQIYPDTIRYTSHGTETGIFEIKFLLENRPAYTEYKRGFAVTTDKSIKKIRVFSHETGSPVLAYEYDLAHHYKNNAVNFVTKITQQKNSNTLPSTTFEYYDGTENTTEKKINVLKKIKYPFGGQEFFNYKPSTAYKIGGAQANPIPFVIHTLSQYKKRKTLLSIWDTTKYDYQQGHYYYDPADAFKKEYAGFGTVIARNPIGNKTKSYFHQSEFDDNNIDQASNGEWNDHLAKKGRQYRQEIFDAQNNLYQTSINRWKKDSLANTNPDESRNFVYLDQTVSTLSNGNNTAASSAQSFAYDTWGNQTNQTNWGKVLLSNQAGNFVDIENDKTVVNTQYAHKNANYLHTNASQIEIFDLGGNIIGRSKNYYDQQAFGNILVGNPTKQETWKDAGTILTTLSAYNSYGLPTAQTNARGFVTNIQYGSHNLYPVSITNPLGHVTNMVYDFVFGVPTQTTDANNLVQQTVLDGFGRTTQTKVSDPNNPTQLLTQSLVTYQNTTVPMSVTQQLFTNNQNISTQSKTFVDGFGRVIQAKQAAQNGVVVTNKKYDSAGNLESQFYPFISNAGFGFESINNTDGVTTVYDALQRPVKIIRPTGTETIEYEELSQVVTNQNGVPKRFVFDTNKNLIETHEFIDGNWHGWRYKHNSLNQLEQIVDPIGNEKNFTYDWLGNTKTKKLWHTLGSNAAEWVFQTDQHGNVIKVTQPDGTITKHFFDSIDRPIKTTTVGGIVETFIYDVGPNSVGKLTQTQTDYLNTQYQYNLLGQVITETKVIDGNNYETRFTYDLLNNPLTIRYPDGITADYHYNQVAQPMAIYTSNNKKIVTNIKYAANGAPTYIEFGNEVETHNTFDPSQNYKLVKRQTIAQGQSVQDLKYIFDPVGNLVQIIDESSTESAKIINFEYDSVDRLKHVMAQNTANNNDYERHFEYDPIGNILGKSDQNGAYEYNGSHPHAVSNIGSQIFGYNANGNLTQANGWSHVWNWQNRMTSSDNGSQSLNYAYDETGTRIKKENTNTGQKTIYINQFSDQEDGQFKNFILVNNLKLATLSDNQVVYHHADHLTGASVDTLEDQTINQVFDYYPFGDVRIDQQIGSFDNDYQYTGKEKDDETGLNYYDARYYDTAVGRFTAIDAWQGDLYQPQSLNKYAYVMNNPLKYVDPSGNFAVEAYLAIKTINSFVRNSHNVNHKVRELNFAINNPISAYRVGIVKDGSTKNISSISSNFAINLSNNYSKGEGSQRNALRHVIWQGIITNKLGMKTASEIGNAHENKPFMNTSQNFKTLSEADSAADLMNNRIGRSVGGNSSSNNSVAKNALSEFHNNGLYTVNKNDSGYGILKTKINATQYKNSLNKLKKLKATGLSKK